MQQKLDSVFPTLSTYEAPKVMLFKGTFGQFAAQYVSLIDVTDVGD